MTKLVILISCCYFLLSVPISNERVEAAERYPEKPITFIVPLEAGSDGDIMARPVVQIASQILGQPIMVVNKPGAGSSMGYREVLSAKPDGYTIGVAYPSLITNKLGGISPFDYHEFTTGCTFYNFILIIVASRKTERPFNTIEEVIEFAKTHPEGVSVASGGAGHLLWLAAMAFQERTRAKFNTIPQPGAGGFTITQVAGGHVDLAIVGFPAAKAQIEAGQVRFVAVFGANRARGYEQVPTLKEVGYDVDIEAMGYLIAPPGMPKNIMNKLVNAFEKAVNDHRYQKFCIERNANAWYLSPDKVVQLLDERKTIFEAIMRKAGILKVK